MRKPYNIKDIKFNNIIFSKVINNNSKRSVLIKYNKNNRLTKCLIQTPEMKILDIYNNGTIIVLVLSVDNTNIKMAKFIQFCSLFDNHIIDIARNNNSWFFSNNVKFKGSIRNDGEYNVPYIKLKINSNLLNRIKVSYDKQTQARKFSDLEKNQTIKLVLDMYGLWINSIGFGLYTKPMVIDIRENNEITFNESSDEDEEIIDTEINPISETSVLNLNTEVNDVDDRMSSEIDSVTNLIELEIEDIQPNKLNNIISENSENDNSEDENNEHMSLKDDISSSSNSSNNDSDSFNINTNTSTDYNDNNNH